MWGALQGFSIGLVGDLANGRTVRSLAYVLSMYDNVKMYFVAPDVVGGGGGGFWVGDGVRRGMRGLLGAGCRGAAAECMLLLDGPQ